MERWSAALGRDECAALQCAWLPPFRVRCDAIRMHRVRAPVYPPSALRDVTRAADCLRRYQRERTWPLLQLAHRIALTAAVVCVRLSFIFLSPPSSPESKMRAKWAKKRMRRLKRKRRKMRNRSDTSRKNKAQAAPPPSAAVSTRVAAPQQCKCIPACAGIIGTLAHSSSPLASLATAASVCVPLFSAPNKRDVLTPPAPEAATAV